MPDKQEFRHPINVRGSQQQLPVHANTPSPWMREDLDKRVREQKEHISRLEQERESIERATRELERINDCKKQFIHQQNELSEKLTIALTHMSRHIVESRKELEALEEFQQSFTTCLKKINNINPEHWPSEELNSKLDKALLLFVAVEDEYQFAANHFENSNHSEIFGISPAPQTAKKTPSGTFWKQVQSGFAHHLALIIFLLLATAALWLK